MILFLSGHGIFDDMNYNDPIGEFTGKNNQAIKL